MIDDQTVALAENINIEINERLDDIKFKIQNGQGGFTLDDEYDLEKYDKAHRNNDPTSKEYGAANGSTPLADAANQNDYSALQ